MRDNHLICVGGITVEVFFGKLVANEEFAKSKVRRILSKADEVIQNNMDSESSRKYWGPLNITRNVLRGELIAILYVCGNIATFS